MAAWSNLHMVENKRMGLPIPSHIIPGTAFKTRVSGMEMSVWNKLHDKSSPNTRFKSAKNWITNA